MYIYIYIYINQKIIKIIFSKKLSQIIYYIDTLKVYYADAQRPSSVGKRFLSNQETEKPNTSTH